MPAFFSFRVTGESGVINLAEKTITGEDFPKAGEWSEIGLPFRVDKEEIKDVEFRVWYLAAAEVEIDYIRYNLAYEAFLNMIGK